MTALRLPGCPSVQAALAWIAREAVGKVVTRVVLFRGPDGLVRGSVLLGAQGAAA